MADFTYQYAVASLPNGINTSTLKKTIRSSNIKTALRKVDVDDITTPTIVYVVFKAQLDAPDGALLDGGDGTTHNDPPSASTIMADHDGTATVVGDQPDPVALVIDDPTNAPVVSMGPTPNVPQFIDATYNWANKSTWWQKSVKKEGAALTEVSPLVYKYPNPNDSNNPMKYWINVNQDELYRSRTRHKSRRVRVYDDGTELVVAGRGESKATSGVDCEIDYEAGLVTLRDDYGAVTALTADFHHVDSQLPGSSQAEYCIVPPADYLVVLEYVEVQFTEGISIEDCCNFAGFMPLNWITQQVDATLDPIAFVNQYVNKEGVSGLQEGHAFLINNPGAIHDNFGVIEGLAPGDIVYWKTNRDLQQPDAFVIWHDASEAEDGIAGLQQADSTTWVFSDGSWSAQLAAPTDVEIPETRDSYPTFQAYIDDCTGNYPIIKGGFTTGPRGEPHGTMQLRFDWTGSKHLIASKGVHLRVWLDNGKQFGPDRTHRATATFYGKLYKEQAA